MADFFCPKVNRALPAAAIDAKINAVMVELFIAKPPSWD
jgi:hypothetical protein